MIVAEDDRRDTSTRRPAVYLTWPQLWSLALVIVSALGGVQLGIYVLALDQHIDGRIKVHNEARDAHLILFNDTLLALRASDKAITGELVKIRIELTEIKTRLDVTTAFQDRQEAKQGRK